MCSKSDKIKVRINDKADEFIEELFQQLLSWYQIELETSVIRNYFIWDCVHLLYYKNHKISFNRGGSYRFSWLKLYQKEGKKIFSIFYNSWIESWRNKVRPGKNYEMPFTNTYDWKTINNSPEKNNWKKVEKNNPTIILNLFWLKMKKIYSTYV